MGILGNIREHFVRTVINDKRGIFPAILPAIGKLAASPLGQAGIGLGLSKLFGGKSEDIEITDQRTEEQKQAAAILQQLGTTGSAAGINLGEAFTGSLGEFGSTGQEQQGLAQLFNQQPNQNISQAGDVFSKFAQSSFDPTTLEPFRKAAVRSEGQALDRLSQAKAATGSRFGTGFGRDASSLIEGTELGIQQQLANLFQNQQQVGLQGAQGLAGVGGQQANQEQNQLQNLFNFGGLERNLANQKAQTELNEFNRQRGETLGRIGLLEGEANRNPFLGVSSIPQGESSFSSLIGSVLGGVGGNIGDLAAKGDISGLFGNLFKKS